MAGTRWANHGFASARVLHFLKSNEASLQSTITVKGQATPLKPVRDRRGSSQASPQTRDD
jgi:hypothetical protein